VDVIALTGGNSQATMHKPLTSPYNDQRHHNQRHHIDSSILLHAANNFKF